MPVGLPLFPTLSTWPLKWTSRLSTPSSLGLDVFPPRFSPGWRRVKSPLLKEASQLIIPNADLPNKSVGNTFLSCRPYCHWKHLYSIRHLFTCSLSDSTFPVLEYKLREDGLLTFLTILSSVSAIGLGICQPSMHDHWISEYI